MVDRHRRREQAPRASRSSASAPAPGWPTTCPASTGRTNSQLMALDEMGIRARELQRTLFDGGFAGICFPKEYGGQGLSRALPGGVHPGVGALRDAGGVQHPDLLHPGPHPARLRDRGAEARAHPQDPLGRGAVGAVPLRALGGLGPGRPGHPGHPRRRRLHPERFEDLELGCLPGRLRPVPGPDRLARAQAPRPHLFIVKIHQPGIEVQQIKMVNGANEFCQEFFDDVAIPVENVLGRGRRRLDGGLPPAAPRARRRRRRLAVHQRHQRRSGGPRDGPERPDRAGPGHRADRGPPGPPAGGRGPGERRGQRQLIGRVTKGIAAGRYPAPAGSLLRLYGGHQHERHYRHRPGDRRGRGGGLGGRRPGGAEGHRVPHAPGRQPGRGQQRDAAQHHQRAGARACPGSSPPTRTGRSTRCGTTRRPRDRRAARWRRRANGGSGSRL